MTGYLLPQPRQAYFRADGTPAVGWMLYTYAAGTDTPLETWQDAAQTAPNDNPIVLDARGEAAIFFDGVYKVVLKDDQGAEVWTGDYVGPVPAEFYTDAVYARFAQPDGSSLSGFSNPDITSPSVQTMQAKASQRLDLRDYNGLDLTGTHDNMAILQAAINDAARLKEPLYIPGGTIACSGSLQVPGGFTGIGVGRPSGGGAGSNIQFTGTAAGFVCGDGVSQYEDGFLFRDLITSRLQPEVPSSGTWDPIDADADFVMNGGADLDLEHVLLLNATRGVNLLGGGGIGRLNMRNVGGQVFVYGLNVELCADVIKCSDIHWWPFWSDTLPANNFSCANADHFYLKRCDTPQFVNVSSIAARSGFRFAKNSYGITTKAHIANAGLDYATKNIWFDSTSEGAYAFFSNVTMGANNSDGSVANIAAVTPRYNVLMEGTNDYLSIENMDLGQGSGPDVWLNGNSEECHLSAGIYVHNYGTELGNTDGCFVSNNNCRLHLHAVPRNDDPGLGKLYDGTGYISTPSIRDYSPTISCGGAPVGVSVSTNHAEYIVLDKTVYVDLDFTFSAIGAGATDVRFSLPFSANSEIGAGYGTGYAINLGMLNILVDGGLAIITLAAGGYPGTSDGASFRAHFEYRI